MCPNKSTLYVVLKACIMYNVSTIISQGKLRVFCTDKGEMDNMEAYCVKCRAKREIRNAAQVTLKNGRPATQGTCPTCGTKVFRIGKG